MKRIPPAFQTRIILALALPAICTALIACDHGDEFDDLEMRSTFASVEPEPMEPEPLPGPSMLST